MNVNETFNHNKIIEIDKLIWNSLMVCLLKNFMVILGLHQILKVQMLIRRKIDQILNNILKIIIFYIWIYIDRVIKLL